MAGISRKFLAALGVEDDKVDEIMSAYSEAINEVKEERDALKENKSALKSAKEELEKLKAEHEELKASVENGKSPYKVKYEALKEEFETFKAETEKEKAHASKSDAYRRLLKEIGISEKRIESVLKVSDIDSIELDQDGNIKNADDIKKRESEEWSDFIEKTETKGADTSTPPQSTGGTSMTKDEIFKIKDASERQKAIAENRQLFGI